MEISSIIPFIKKYKYAILLTLVVILAAFLRFYHLSTIPNGFNPDEMLNGYDAYSLGLTLRDHHGEFLPILLQSAGDWVSPTLTYLTVPFVRVMGLSVFSVRFPNALFGVVTVLLLYVFLLQITKRKDLSLIGAFIFAIIPWHITLSRWAIPPSIVPFCLMLSLVTFYWSKEDHSKRGYLKLIPFILSAVLLTYAYPTEKVFAPVLVFSLCAIYFFKEIKKGLFAFIPYLLLISPQYFLVLIDPRKYNARFNYISITGTYNYSHKVLLYQFFLRYRAYILPNFNFGFGDLDPLQHVQGIPSSYGFLEFLFYFGVIFSIFVVIYYLVKRKTIMPSLVSWKDHLILLIWFFVAPIPAALTMDYDHTLRAVQYLPLVVIYFIIGLYFFISTIKNKYKIYLVFIAIFFIGCLSFFEFQDVYYNYYAIQSKHYFYYGIGQAINYAVSHQNQYNTIYLDSTLNEPYIFYLFYSKYDPREINYKALNSYYVEGEYFHPQKIGKYNFTYVMVPTKANVVDKVEDSDGVWYTLYAYNKNLYIIKTLN